VIGPEMRPGSRIDELTGDAHPAPGLAHAAFEHVAHAELTRDPLRQLPANLKAPAALRLTIPPSILAQANVVIE
jgi:hypothetical protein